MGRASRSKALRSRPASQSSGVTVRVARPGEGAAVLKLLQLIDQDEAGKAAIVANTGMIDANYSVPRWYGTVLHLVAEDAGGIVGVLAAAPPADWTESVNAPDEIRQALRQAMIEVTGLAVAESARGAHLGQQLLQVAEQRARAVGCRLALVTFKEELRHLLDYYGEAGFTVLEPGEPLAIRHGRHIFALPHHDVRVAIKPLHPQVVVSAASLPGLPALRRIIDGVITEP